MPNEDKYWLAMKSGEYEQAIAHFKNELDRKHSAPQIMELGVAFLFAEKYLEALEHFHHAIAEYPQKMDTFFGMAGVAEWCMNHSHGAVREWQAGLKAGYTDDAGGVGCPLLLFTAAVLKSDAFPKSKAEQILTMRLSKPRAVNWPGPLAKYVLGQGDDDSIQDLTVGINDEDSQYRRWKLSFYQAVLERARGGGRSEFTRAMRRFSDISTKACPDERSFFSRIWSEEFHIARYEAASR